jgi:O-antigen/teichoic acid export membrane protein
LLILVAPFPLIPLIQYGRSFMTGLGRLRASFAMNMFAAVANIGLDFALIPGHGAIGAAVANATAQLVAGIPVLVYMTRHLNGLEWRRGAVVRTAVCSAAAGGVAWAVGRALGGAGGLAAGLLAGILVFAAFGRIARPLVRDDAAWLDAAVGGGLHGGVGRAVRFFAP